MVNRKKSQIVSTGIEKLDIMLGGGLPRHRGYMISGPIHSGKRLLALTIQKASLERGEYNQYSIYGQNYSTILDDYRGLGINPEKFMDAGILKIIDYYTSEMYSNEDIEQIRNLMNLSIRRGVTFMPPKRLESEIQKYIEEMRKYIDIIGDPGTVIVDSLNDRLLKAPFEKVLLQWRTLKDQMSRKSGLMSLHLYTPLGMEVEKKYAEYFHQFEDGIIDLNINKSGEREIRLRMRIPQALDDSWHTFRIIDSSIVIEEDAEMIEQAGLNLAGLTGIFVKKITVEAAKWIWNETAKIIERYQNKNKLKDATKKEKEEISLVIGEVPEKIGLPRKRTLKLDMITETLIAEIETLREEIISYQKRYLKFRRLVAESGDYAEERDKRNLKESAEALENRLLRLLEIIKKIY